MEIKIMSTSEVKDGKGGKIKSKGFTSKPKPVEMLALSMGDEGFLFPMFHIALMLEWFLERNNLLTSTIYNEISQWDLYFKVCPDVDAIKYIRNLIVRIIQKHDTGSVTRRIGSDEQKWQARMMDAVLQDVMRPIKWKIDNPNGLSMQYQSDYTGIIHTRGSRLIADLILEPWKVMDLGKYGTLKVIVRPNERIYNEVREAFPQLQKFEEANPPFSQGSLDGALTSLTHIEKLQFDAKPYVFRTTAPRLPAIGDLFFFIEVSTYIYTLVNDRVNSLSMSLNYFLHTEVTDSKGDPVGRTIQYRTITINPDGTRTESIADPSMKDKTDNDDSWSKEVGSYLIEKLFIWEKNYNLSLILKSMGYIVYGNTDLAPSFNLGWKGEPGGELIAGGGTGPKGSGGSSPSGQAESSGSAFSASGYESEGMITTVEEPSASSSGKGLIKTASMLGKTRDDIFNIASQFKSEFSNGTLTKVEADKQLRQMANKFIQEEKLSRRLVDGLASHFGIIGKAGGYVANATIDQIKRVITGKRGKGELVIS